MKKYTITLIIFLAFFGFNHSEAVKMAVFPDGKMLQPIPTNVRPNISGNINATVKENTPKINMGVGATEEGASPTQGNKASNPVKSYTYLYWILCLPLLLLFLFAYHFLKKRR
ncbi:MAG: hypothetical protein WCK91_02755 [bacterium]